MMRRLTLLFFVVIVCTLLAGCLLAKSVAPISKSEIEALLPEGETPAEIMDVVGSPRLNELVRQFQEAGKRNPQRFMDDLKNSEPGKPLPYDPQLGMSEAYYNEMVKGLQEVRLQKVGTATLSFHNQGGGWVRLDSDSRALSDYKGLLIDPERGIVRTPFGDLSRPERTEPNENQKAGRWRGFCWDAENGNMQSLTGQTVEFCMGRREDSGQGIFHYSVKAAQSGQPVVQIERVVQYDLSH